MSNRLQKRILSLVLAVLAAAVAFLPQTAKATVLPGYTSPIDYDNTDRQNYIIDIDLTNQLIFVRERASGNIVLQSICSTGMTGFATFSGTSPLGHLKERAGFFIEFNSYALYWSQIARCVYIHSILFSSPEGTHKSMSRKTYGELNRAVSHGCVRVLPDVAQWIFYNCPPGTEVKIGGRKRLEKLRKRLKYEQPTYETYYVPRDDKPAPELLNATLRRTASLGTGVVGNTKFVCTVSKGEQVKLLQTSPTWCKVLRENGQMGYILRRFLNIELNRGLYTTIDDVSAKPVTTTLFSAVPIAAGTPLYGEAKPVQPKRDVIVRRLTELSIIEVTGDFCKYWRVNYGHLTGYVLKSQVQEYTDLTR